MNTLYTENGWLNFEYIANKGAWLNIIIGARQVGKTYNCLHYLLEHNAHFILLRRTKEEIETIRSNKEVNPFVPFEPDYHVDLFKDGKLCKLCHYIVNDEGKTLQGAQIGLALGLSQIANIRGFSGGLFTDIVFDEFIPEKGVITRYTEGDSFLNAYTTINGNRELKGLPPLRAWLLANSNRIDSPILESLNVVDMVLYMRRKGKEELMNENGVLIIQPESKQILDQRKNTALMKQVNKSGEFYNMAIENEFSYDDSPYIKTLPLKGMHPCWSYGNIYCWSNGQGFYLCRAPFTANAPKYDETQTGREKIALDFAIMKAYYYADCIAFSDLRTLTIFKQIFNL